MKDSISRFAIKAVGAYFRALAGAPWNEFLYRTVVRPYLSWRPLEMVVGTDIGARVRMGDAVRSSIALYGLWEPGITNYVRETLKRGDVFIEIGGIR